MSTPAQDNVTPNTAYGDAASRQQAANGKPPKDQLKRIADGIWFFVWLTIAMLVLYLVGAVVVISALASMGGPIY